MKWHRTTIQDDGQHGTGRIPILVYTPGEADWAAWSIDRVPASNGSRTRWYVYQVRYNGERMGLSHPTLREAKEFVERTGRE
jgi:hypothetical protein